MSERNARDGVKDKPGGCRRAILGIVVCLFILTVYVFVTINIGPANIVSALLGCAGIGALYGICRFSVTGITALFVPQSREKQLRKAEEERRRAAQQVEVNQLAQEGRKVEKALSGELAASTEIQTPKETLPPHEAGIRERKDIERIAREKSETERVAREHAEADRLAREAEQELLEASLAREQAAQVEADRLAREQAKREQISREKESPVMRDAPRQSLRHLVLEYGRSICNDPMRCRSLLLDVCGEYRREINILITVLEEQVVSDLLSAPLSVPREIFHTRLTRRVCENRGLTEEVARWGVQTWVFALGL